jgi:ribosomal protein uS17
MAEEDKTAETELEPEAAGEAQADEPEPTGEEPAAEAAAEEGTPEAPAAEAEPEEEREPAADAPEPAAAATEPPPAAEPRRKKKRLARAQRPRRTRPTREKPKKRKPIVRLPKPEAERGRSQERRGVVVSSAMDKTIVVKVDTIKAHPRYKKVVRRSAKFHAHDEQNAAKVGDLVRIVETRPFSKTKRWRLAEVVEAAK